MSFDTVFSVVTAVVVAAFITGTISFVCWGDLTPLRDVDVDELNNLQESMSNVVPFILGLYLS
eukprot:CAMPEP_0204343452 /NCGR_PEP_ID=MMETSP0469-20131031/24913_1 /ASSEMBLY_ACC=CAM_ASM_000384 /TAXON_ID=2969 /ORGANISM="Oxyrrhis marina" /LENGTH=62 /DNA_ID=CAMNT_0051328557 /DNA_START=6 /DNA_END=190 /DNA_ORIENTATION=+